ncbi:MAG: hypothetical protein JJ897_08580 [Marinibacterium sp.]|nr:hypothetical protein [Marinibacterium sp.]
MDEHPVENLFSGRQRLTETNELAAVAGSFESEIDRFGAASSATVYSASLEPIPDIRDPTLLRKLAAILKP